MLELKHLDRVILEEEDAFVGQRFNSAVKRQVMSPDSSTEEDSDGDASEDNSSDNIANQQTLELPFIFFFFFSTFVQAMPPLAPRQASHSNVA